MQLKADQRVDILFSNIKHLFFQPCDREMAVIIHIHLKTPILVGKKKTKDIQFFREALESHVDDTGGARRRRPAYGDEDEIAQERDERRKRQAANAEFQGFGERVVESAARECGLELEVPFRDLGFDGVPGRQSVLLQPTTECLVFLSEPPYLIVTLREVEIAYLERVMFGLKNFDLVFIFKDHTRPPVHVTSIPMSSLEAVKDWLDSMDVLFAESTVNFNWTNIMKTVIDDPVGFYEMGGWSYLQPGGVAGSDAEGGAGSDEDEEAGSSEYEPDEEDEEEEFEDEEEDEFSEEEEDDDDEDDEDDEDEEEEDFSDEDDDDSDAPDWDDLEKEARREDSRRERDSSSKRRAPAPAPKSSSKRR
jgi:Xaa-Pro aminopeptidase